MSVAWRSCASRTSLSFSGCEDKEGGERSSTRFFTVGLFGFVDGGLKSEVVSRVTEGTIAAEEKSERHLSDCRKDTEPVAFRI